MTKPKLSFRNAGIPNPSHYDHERFFYESDQWIDLRMDTLTKNGNYCLCCGNSPFPGNPLQVDHIKPRSRFPELALDPRNLQVLCRQCNSGKGARDMTDWRSSPTHTRAVGLALKRQRALQVRHRPLGTGHNRRPVTYIRLKKLKSG